MTKERSAAMETGLKNGVQRWIVDISQWNPSPQRFSSAISLLPQHQRSSVTRFAKMEDRKRALVSKLLQYGVVNQVLGIPFDEICIRSTVEGKPYVHFDRMQSKFQNFNFSVSHHGDFVAIASEPFFLVGLDIVSPSIPVKETIPQFVNNFASYFTCMEWDKIINTDTCDMLQMLYRYWSLKEAFIKAIGSGLTYSLNALEFNHKNWSNIYVKLHDENLSHWKFWHFELKGHYVSISRGPPHMAAESFKQTLAQKEVDEHLCDSGFDLPNESFMWKSVDQLIDEYASAVI